MWVLSQDGLNLINADKFSVVKKEFEINAYNIYSNGIKLGTYQNIEKAKRILHEIYMFIVQGYTVYVMPTDTI